MYGSNAYDDNISLVSGKLANLMFTMNDYNEHRKQASSLIWTTKDGRKKRVCDLTENHINNIINFLSLKEPSKLTNYFINFLRYELEVRNNYDKVNKELIELTTLIDTLL